MVVVVVAAVAVVVAAAVRAAGGLDGVMAMAAARARNNARSSRPRSS